MGNLFHELICLGHPDRDSIALFQMSKLMSESLRRAIVLLSLVYSASFC